MKKLILEYLANFISRWDAANDERRVKLTYEYKAFCGVYTLPNLCASDLEHDIKRGVVIVNEQEEEQEEDLFEFPEKVPVIISSILSKYQDGEGYGVLDEMLRELKPHGYTFSYGLDAVPYNLRKIEQEESKVFAKYKTVATPEGTYLKPEFDIKNYDFEVRCGGYYNDGRREPSLDGYYFKQDLILIEDFKALSSPAAAKDKWMNKLEESKTQPRKFQPHDTPWDFVEEYYPNYSSSDEICEANDLNLILERKNSIMDEEGTDLHQRYISEFDGQICAVMNRHDQLMKEIYEQAIENFINSQNK